MDIHHRNVDSMKSLRIYYRSLARDKVFSLISIGGFSLSLAVVVLLLAFIRSEKQYDRSIPEVEQIYRVLTNDHSSSIPEQARDKLLSEYPQVSSATKVLFNNSPVLHKEQNYDLRVVHTDSGFFRVFSIPVVAGQRDQLFRDPHQVVLTQSGARKIFGEENPIGQILNISHEHDVEVVAVVQDFPEKSSLQGEMFCSADLRITYSKTSNGEKEAFLYNLFIKFQPENGPGLLQDTLTALIHPFLDWYEGREYSFSPFKDAYFDIDTQWDGLSHANVKLLSLLGWLSLVILILAVFNYINLTIAQSTGRLHELGVKQVFGADRSWLVRQFIREAFSQVVLALMLAFVLALFLKPVLGGILGKAIDLSILLKDLLTLLMVLVGLPVVAIVSGIYPALAILRLQPREMLLKQTGPGRRSFDIRRLLTILQFTVLVALIISLITLVKQLRYVQDKDLGYSTELLVRLMVHYRIQDKVPAMMEEISSLAVVKSCCSSMGVPGEIWSNSSDDNIATSHIYADYRFLETFELELSYGRNFFPAESTEVCLINESLLNDLGGWDSAENREVFGEQVVGVIRDFHFEDLYTPMGNLQIRNEPEVGHLCLRFYPGDIAKAISSVEEVFKKHAPGYAFNYEFYDQWMQSRYAQEEKRAQSIRLLSLIAILLSCMGLFGMAHYAARRRVREIGIRKVNGASGTQILRMLNLDFLKWILPGIAAGIPLGWYFMQKWLSSFAYRTRLDWWNFGLAALVALLVAVLTVSWQSWRAARKNPVEALRYE
jgi:putative ABC transport system permease protein